ncbi:unnamed protein product [Lathyrus sativus]|nr:unnamed protein product [Lathyrus sativus]
MTKLIFVLVFAIAVAMPLRTVMGQANWQDLMGDGDLSESIDQAKKALGAANTAAAGQAAFDDYFGGGDFAGEDGGGAAGGYGGSVPAGDGAASLAGFIEENMTAEEQPTLPVDSPIGAPEDLPAPVPEGSQTDYDDSFAPGRSPIMSPDEDEGIIDKRIVEAEGIVDKRFVGAAPIESPDGAPSDDEDDMDTPDGAPAFAPGVSGFDDDDN